MSENKLSPDHEKVAENEYKRVCNNLQWWRQHGQKLRNVITEVFEYLKISNFSDEVLENGAYHIIDRMKIYEKLQQQNMENIGILQKELHAAKKLIFELQNPSPPDHEKVAREIAVYIRGKEGKEYCGEGWNKDGIAAILSSHYTACQCEKYRELLERAYPFVRKFGHRLTADDILAALAGGKEADDDKD